MTPGELIDRIIGRDSAAVIAALAEQPALASAREQQLGITPLHFAAHRGFGEIVSALIAAGADVRACEDGSGATPLHWAAEAGHREVASWLVACGADLEARDAWYGLTPLGWGTLVSWAPGFHADRAATAKALRDAGALEDPFTCIAANDADGLRALVAADRGALSRRLGFVGCEQQPLHVAISEGRGALVDILLELGADPEARTARGLTALGLALEGGDPAIILRLRGGEDDIASALVTGDDESFARHLPDAPEPLLGTLLLLAAEKGRTRAVELLLARGGKVEARLRALAGERAASLAPLHLAARAGHADIVRLLLAAGADASAGVRESGPTPLHFAAREGHLAVVKLLVAGGADREARESGSRARPVEWAEHAGQTEVASLLRRTQG